MARYIDADKFIEWLDVGHLRPPSEICLSELNVKKMIELQPTADVVPVVRCKDCGMSRETEDERYLFCMNFADTVSSQAFCSYGERKNDNGNG